MSQQIRNFNPNRLSLLYLHSQTMKFLKFAICTWIFAPLWVCLPVIAQPSSITILHTNDMHAGFLPHQALWIHENPKPLIGGFKELAWEIDSVRKTRAVSILLDAGDVMTGNPISDYYFESASGGALFAMMNEMGYDVWTVGNHDLDISQDNLRALIAIAKFPTVCDNLMDSTGHPAFGNKPYVILSRGGLKIGVIGVMSTDLFHLTNTNNLHGLKVASPIEETQRYLDSIAGRTDLTVALTHEGVDADSVLAISTHGLDVIIGGHSHTRLRTPKLINGVIICQTGSDCENLGELDLSVDHHKIVTYDGKLIPLWASHQTEATPVSQIVDAFKDSLDKDFNTVVGTLTEDWKRNARGESNIGHFIADAIRETGQAQIGITNSSGIRKDLEAGPIRKSDIFEIMPFRNIVCTFRMTGKDVRQFVERTINSLAEGRSALQLSGLSCTWKLVDGKPTIVTLTTDGKSIGDDGNYTCATSDFVLDQGVKYLGFEPQDAKFMNATVYEAIVAKVMRDKTIDARIESRFNEIK